jgi:hypothetical protein
MIARPETLAQVRAHVSTAMLAASIFLMATTEARSQAQAPPSSRDAQVPGQQTVPQQDAQTPSQPAREANPGLLNELGKMLDKFPTLKSPQQTIEDFNRDAASWLAKPSSMVSGRIICPISANGAADCKLGADKLCQAKGFKEGKSLNVDAAQTCSAKVLIPGRTRKPDDCRTDNYVTHALCQ